MTSTLLKTPLISTPKLHRIANGLTIVAQQMPVEAVNLSLWVNVGSAVESNAINGVAHFLEHMVFKGTPQLTMGEFERRIEARGAIANAATSQDYTQFYITTAPSDFAALAPLQIDIVLNSLIPDDAFELERLVVLEEIRRSDDNPRRRTFQRAMEIAFDRLPYRRSVLGTVDAIAQLQPQQMRDFHATWYQPQSITASVVGNLPETELIEIVANSFAKHTPDSQHPSRGAQQCAPTDSRLHPEPPFTQIVRHEFVDPSLQQARLVMLWRVPGLVQLEQTYALDVLAAILSHGRTSRLVRELREEKGWVSNISVSNLTQHLQGLFYVSAQMPVENLEMVEAAIASQIEKIQSAPVQESEIARIGTQVANRFIFANETPSERAGLYGYYQSLTGNLASALEYPNKIQALTTADLQAAAVQYLSPSAYGIVTTKPE
ncbi:insulinase family protein [Chroococcidiopsis sp. FACHB-1243]|uniref:M16 family metallopeptidase n=1 Tax=Chroococcidiopsis sp. [FACHB-1243] TaxID=2692781 RepID=UPI001785C55E|nr:pitrilysin family protein [Chroococcidiopsis sp. [FACHB-1243]]MBD2306868.1 insulinase family protein [Chroococcidiopsis sp. [FACHB-1243]]